MSNVKKRLAQLRLLKYPIGVIRRSVKMAEFDRPYKTFYDPPSADVYYSSISSENSRPASPIRLGL